jgi:hypothetical protein
MTTLLATTPRRFEVPIAKSPFTPFRTANRAPAPAPKAAKRKRLTAAQSAPLAAERDRLEREKITLQRRLFVAQHRLACGSTASIAAALKFPLPSKG